MNNWDEVRAAIYTAVISAYPSTDIIVPGSGEPDLTTRTVPFIKLQVNPRSSVQMALCQGFPKRRFGTVELSLFVKESQGDKVLFDLLEVVDNLFTARTLSDIVFSQTLMLSPSRGVGWTSQVSLASFHFDDIT